MTAVKVPKDVIAIPPETAQLYIIQMLDELSLMAKTFGLNEMASLLKATSAASKLERPL